MANGSPFDDLPTPPIVPRRSRPIIPALPPRFPQPGSAADRAIRDRAREAAAGVAVAATTVPRPVVGRVAGAVARRATGIILAGGAVLGRASVPGIAGSIALEVLIPGILTENAARREAERIKQAESERAVRRRREARTDRQRRVVIAPPPPLTGPGFPTADPIPRPVPPPPLPDLSPPEPEPIPLPGVTGPPLEIPNPTIPRQTGVAPRPTRPRSPGRPRRRPAERPPGTRPRTPGRPRRPRAPGRRRRTPTRTTPRTPTLPRGPIALPRAPRGPRILPPIFIPPGSLPGGGVSPRGRPQTRAGERTRVGDQSQPGTQVRTRTQPGTVAPPIVGDPALLTGVRSPLLRSLGVRGQPFEFLANQPQPLPALDPARPVRVRARSTPKSVAERCAEATRERRRRRRRQCKEFKTVEVPAHTKRVCKRR